MIDNMKMLDIARAVFEKYDLPNGAQVDANHTTGIRVSWVYTGGEGVKEMAQIVSGLQPEDHQVQSRGGFVVIEKPVQVKRRWVEFRAQMCIVEEQPKVSTSARVKTLKAIGL